MNKKLKLIIFIALISFLMLACSMVYNTSFNEDGSGTFSLEVSFTQEEVDIIAPMLSEYGTEIETPAEICDAINDELEVDINAQAEFITEGTNYTCLIEFPFADFDELENIYDGFDVYITDLGFTDDGFFIYDVGFNLGEEIDSGLNESDIDLDIEYLWEVTSPYNVIEHNADSISGKTMTVEIDSAGYTELFFIAGSGGISELYSDSSFEFLTQILEDESGTFHLDFLFDADQEEELLELLEDLDIGDEAEDWCDEISDLFEDLEGFPSGMDTEFEQEEVGEGFACRNTFEFDDLDELEELYEEFGFIEPDTLKIKDNVLDYEVAIDLASAGAMGLDDLEADVELFWTVSSPWSVVEHDADNEDGRLVSWEMKDGDDLEVVFTAEKSNLLLYLLIGGGGLLFVGVAVIVVVLIAKNKKTKVE